MVATHSTGNLSDRAFKDIQLQKSNTERKHLENIQIDDKNKTNWNNTIKTALVIGSNNANDDGELEI